jgi:ribose transport system ATP-binding protein
VPYLLYGARPCRAGRLTLEHVYDLTAMTPARALEAGIALLPGERRRGGVASLSVGANVTLPALDRYASRHRLDHRRMRRDAADLLARQGVDPADPGSAFRTLSGGNQQKALLAKALGTHPRLLLLDEPTRGVDVGARRGILSAIRSLAQDGVCVVCASADSDQLAELCDRVLVFSGGAVAEHHVTR